MIRLNPVFSISVFFFFLASRTQKSFIYVIFYVLMFLDRFRQ